MKSKFKRIPMILAMASIGFAASVSADGTDPKHIILENGSVIDIPFLGEPCKYNYNTCLGGWRSDGTFPGVRLKWHQLKAVSPDPRPIPSECERGLSLGGAADVCNEG